MSVYLSNDLFCTARHQWRFDFLYFIVPMLRMENGTVFETFVYASGCQFPVPDLYQSVSLCIRQPGSLHKCEERPLNKCILVVEVTVN